MDAITDVITAAVEDVNTSEETYDGDATEAAGSTDAEGGSSSLPETVGPDGGETGGTVSAPATDAVKPAVSDADPLTKDLEELGLKAPEDGQRENRIPYSRVRKIVENAQKKVEARFTTERDETKTRLTTAETKAAQLDAVDKLIASDPDRYLSLLATLHPVYKKFTQPQVVAPPAAKAPEPVVEQPPPPDHKFEDGSMGYTQEGYQRLVAWQMKQAEDKAVARMEKQYAERLGPLEQNWKTQQANAALQPVINAQIERNKAIWGKAFEDEYKLDSKSEIFTYMQANPLVPFDAAVAAVLAPRAAAAAAKPLDRDAMRKSILDELNGRPAAAVKGVGGPKKPASDVSTGPRSMEDVIREAIASVA